MDRKSNHEGSMYMAEIIDVASLPWHPVRPELTRGVEGRDLLNGPVKAVLTRVAPGGSFAAHRDPYDHLFYLLAGEAVLEIEGSRRPVGPGALVRVACGELHGYRNEGQDDLLLLSLNLPSPP